MFRLGAMVVIAGILAGCQTASSPTASSSSPKVASDWKPWVLKKYDVNRDGQLRGSELKAAIDDDRVRRNADPG
jgi:hypothetical protein